jgi:hypothetical protein
MQRDARKRAKKQKKEQQNSNRNTLLETSQKLDWQGRCPMIAFNDFI